MWVIFDQHVDSQAGTGEDSTDDTAQPSPPRSSTNTREYLQRSATSPTEVSPYSPRLTTPDRTEKTSSVTSPHHNPTATPRLLEILAVLDRELFVSSTVVVITAANEGNWIDALVVLRRRGVQVICIVLDRQSFGGESNESAHPAPRDLRHHHLPRLYRRRHHRRVGQHRRRRRRRSPNFRPLLQWRRPDRISSNPTHPTTTANFKPLLTIRDHRHRTTRATSSAALTVRHERADCGGDA